MRCPSCGTDTLPRRGACMYCGARLPSKEAAAQGPNPEAAPGMERLAALQEELSGIEFALQELDAAPGGGARAGATWEMARSRLFARRHEIEGVLIRLYGSLPPSEALGHLTDFLFAHPRNAHAHLERGRVHQQMGHDHAAVGEYLLAASLDPGNAEPHLRLAQLYELLQWKAEALYEYTTYVAVESDPDRRRAAEDRLRSLARELVPQRGEYQDQAVDETAQRLEYLLVTLRGLAGAPGGERGVLQQLVERYTQRLDALTAAAAPVPAPPARPPKRPAVPPKPREPFDWGAFWAPLFSERTLTALLGFGVLLVAVSSLVLLISLWSEFSWPIRQAFLLGQLFVFLAMGYVVKERFKLHLSGLALISVAALWVPFNVGALVFEHIGAPAERLLPGIDLPLDLPIYGWLIIAGTCVPTWSALTYRFKGHLLMHGTVASVGATVALFLAVLGVTWEWQVAALAVLTIPLLFTWHYLRQTSLKVVAEPLFWTAQAILVGVAAGLLVAWTLGETGSYPLAIVAVAGTGLYAAVHRFSPSLAYEYVFSGLPVIALLLALAEGEALPFRHYDALLMGMAVGYLMVGRAREKNYQLELLRSSRWPALQPAYAVGYLLAVAAVLWPSFHEVSRLGVLYGAAAVAVASARWSGRSFWIYLAATLLLAAWGLTLDLTGIPPLLWSTPLMALAIAYLGLGLLLRGRSRATATEPLYHVGYGVTVVALLWAVAAFRALPADTDLTLLGQRLLVSAGLFLGAAAYAGAAYRRGAVPFAHLAAWTLAAALGMVLIASELPLRYAGIPVALAALAYVAGGAALTALHHPESSGGAEGPPAGLSRRARLSAAFSWPLVVTGYGVALLSLGIATTDMLSVRDATWPTYLVYGISVGILGASAYLSRTPAYLHGAAALFLLPFTLLIYDLFGETSELLALPSAALAFGWAGLAIGYLVAGIAVERRAPRYSQALPALGYLLLLAAAAASLGSAERQSVVFGVIVVAAGASAFLTHRRLTSDVPRLMSKLFDIPEAITRRYTVAAFVAVASLLTPLWGLETLALFTREAPAQGLALALAAPAYVLIGALIARRAVTLYAWPVYLAGYGMTVAAPLLTLSSLPLNITTLAIGSATYALSAYVFRRSAWSYVFLYISAALLPAILIRVLSGFDLSDEAFGLGLMAMALLYIGTAALAERWTGSVRLAELLSRRFLTLSGYAAPLYVVGILLSGVAAGLGIPESSGSWPISIGVFSLGALNFGLAAFRLRSPLLLYPSLGLAVAGYSLGLALLPLDEKYVGLALLPGAAASLGVGWVLHRWVHRPGASTPATIVAHYLDAARAMAWEIPFLVAGYGLSLAAVTLSLPDELQRLLALLGVTGIYAVSLGVYRAPGWLYPLLLSAHLAFASLLTLVGFDLPAAGLLFIPPTLAMGYFLRLADRRAKSGGPRALLAPWATPFAVFGLLDMGTSVALAAFADWAGLVASASYAALAALVAHATLNRIAAYASAAFVTLAVIFASRMLGLGWSESAVVWASQGLLMWWGGQAMGALSRRGRPEENPRTKLPIWQAPLRNVGVGLSWLALALVAALFFSGLFAPDRFGSAVQDATAVLAVLGLLYLGMAFLARRVWFGYLAVGLLLASWTLQLIDREIPYAQAYAIPAGLYLLAIAYSERRRLQNILPVSIECGALLLLVVSAFWQSVTDDPVRAYAILLGVEAVLLVGWGAVNRTRLLFTGGIVAFVVNLLYQTTGMLSTLPGAWVGLIVGLLIVTAIAGIEWRRERLIDLAREWSGRMSQWSW